jgi:hypothetical protein
LCGEEEYCAEFGRKGLADVAFEKLDKSLKSEQKLANLSEEFAK